MKNKLLDALKPELLSEEECRVFFLGGLAPACPVCSAPYHAPERFYANLQCVCKSCGKKFFAITGTPFSAAKIGGFRGIFLMLLLIEMGWKTGRIARALGVDPHTVARWRGKARTDE